MTAHDLSSADIQLVAERTNTTLDEARAALSQCGGDLARAIEVVESGNVDSSSSTQNHTSANFPQSDIRIVAERGDATLTEAQSALERSNGDIAAAIEDIK